MDKSPVYPGSIPRDVDILQPQRNVEIALGFMLQAVFGTTTVTDGLMTTQTVVPSMGVLVGPGSIIFATTVDTLTTGFGSLAADNTDPLVKIGINLMPTTLGALTPPVTAGYSVNVLVEAQFIEADGAPTVLPYYNAANPAQPYTGPANAGTPNNTARTNKVQLQYKYGTAAASGSQVTPSPDAGWIGVYVVTVANGQSSVVNANISPYVGASGITSIPTKLPFLRQKLTAALNLYVSATGSDSNSGLSAAAPFATLQKAWNVIINGYDLNGFGVTVNVANGTYSQGLSAAGSVTGLGTGNAVFFLGNSASPGNVVITTSNQHCFAATNGANIALSGFSMTAAGSVGPSPAGAVVASSNGSVSIIGNMTFGSCSGPHIWATQTGGIVLGGSYSITGGATAHYLASASGSVIGTIGTATLTGTPAFSTAFVAAQTGSLVQVTGGFSGGCSGVKYDASLNGVINTSGSGVGYYPGTVAGVITGGGQYA